MNRKPRVLIDSFHLIQALTGIRTYTTQLIDGLESLDQNDVEYLVYPNWRWINSINFLRGKVNPLKKIMNHFLYFFWKQFCLPALILFKRIDVVVSLDYLLPCVKFRAKSIAVIHDTFYWELKGKYNPVWRTYFLNSVTYGLNSHTMVIATTQYIAKKIKTVVTDKHRISVVYQAPKDLIGKEDSDFGLEELGLSKGSKYFMHVGIFEERKNIELLVKAFEKLSKRDNFADYLLVLAGGKGVGVFHDNFSTIRRLISDMGLEKKVILTGFVPDNQLKILYERAFAYVFPSKEEGFGIPVLEAMKSGIPVIISDQPALMEVAGGAALIFEMDNVESLFNQMLELENDDLRTELIVRGNQRAQRFTRKAFVNQFHFVVKEVIKH